MSPSFGSVFNDPLLLLVLVGAVGLVCFLVLDTLQDVKQRRRERRLREQVRRQFWGYE